MKVLLIVLFLVCIAAAVTAGCTTGAPPSATPTPTKSPTVTGVPATPKDGQECMSDQDCVPAQCCHPISCASKALRPSCGNVMCTMSCEGPIDCGAGSCGCVEGRCSVVPASTGSGLQTK